MGKKNRKKGGDDDYDLPDLDEVRVSLSLSLSLSLSRGQTFSSLQPRFKRAGGWSELQPPRLLALRHMVADPPVAALRYFCGAGRWRVASAGRAASGRR